MCKGSEVAGTREGQMVAAWQAGGDRQDRADVRREAKGHALPTEGSEERAPGSCVRRGASWDQAPCVPTVTGQELGGARPGLARSPGRAFGVSHLRETCSSPSAPQGGAQGDPWKGRRVERGNLGHRQVGGGWPWRGRGSTA